SLGRRDGTEVVFERFGEDPAAAFLIEPFKLRAPEGENAAQHELGGALRVGLGVSERERCAPGPTEHLPALDAEMLAQLFDIGDEVQGGVLVDAGMRRRAAAATLVEQDDAIAFGIVIPPHYGGGTAPGSAMQHNGGLSARIAALLIIELVQSGNLEPARAV